MGIGNGEQGIGMQAANGNWEWGRGNRNGNEKSE